MVDKLSKALDGLKNIQFTTSMDDKSISKKEKMFFCVLAADVMVSVKPMNMQNLPMVIENIINLFDDKDSDVKMVADESLNRIIMATSESDMPKIQVELLKAIKRNGPARGLRAALSRYGHLSQYIRPNKGKVHVQMLIPSLLEISKREEESVHETLASSFENIFKVLGLFMKDYNLKSLIKAFLHNLSSVNPVIRRCSATCIIKLVQYCQKPHVFNSFVLNSILDCVIPICEETSVDLILGVLGCLRLLLPSLTSARHDEGISGSFGLRRKQEESFFSIDRLIQAYELCLHYTKSTDHNVVTAALETLNQILQNPPQQLESFFLSPAGFSRSYIHSSRENKLWSRSGSEMSVASSSLPPMDESLLLDDADISTFSGRESFSGTKQSASRIKEKFVFSESEEAKTIENPFREKVLGKLFGSQSTLDNDSDTESSVLSELNTPPLFLSGDGKEEEVEEEEEESKELSVEFSRSSSQDNLYSPNETEELNNSLTNAADVGSFTDAAVPLIYCARHLAASFLLDPASNCLRSDRTTRVSIKSLAFSCLSAIINLHPVILRMNLSKNPTDRRTQEMSDVLLYFDHCDPQIRGCVNVLIGSFIRSALLESKGFPSDWFAEEKSQLNLKNLINIILEGLKDKSSVCNRQALSAVKTCINIALLTEYNRCFLPLLNYLPVLTDNSYWLVKVKLVEVLSDLPFSLIRDLINSNSYQEEVIDFVLLPLHGDEDVRVRLAAAEALVKIVPMLCDEKSPVLKFAKSFADDLNKRLKTKKDFNTNSAPFKPFSHALKDPQEIEFGREIEFSLSKIVSKLTNSLIVCETKYFLFGYIESLKLLTEKYPPTMYLNGWNCSLPNSEKADKNYQFLTSDLVSYVYSLLVTSPSILDLTAYSNATVLMGNLFAGHCIGNLKSNYETSVHPGENGELWNVFKCPRLSRLAEEIFTHLLKVLNLYSCLAEKIHPSSLADSSSVASNSFLPLLSPVKKHEKKSLDKGEDRKTRNSYNFSQTTQYAKLQQLLQNAHATYKVSLDKPVGEKFLSLLESTLYALSVLLEVGTVQETGRCAEEILSYLWAIVSLRAGPTITCVIQLLKSLFGVNLATNWEGKKFSSINYHGRHLFDSLFQLPTEFLSEKIHRRTNLNSLECENLSGRLRRPERKVFIKYADKNSLSTYIRLFEPMVVKSLKLYTITGNVELQSNVLQLLNQLVQLRVNYCLLDEKQVFVGFVLKQFELIEHGQIPGIEILLPQIFKFLVLLSNEKQHSKPIMSIPKILQLCDGLMASDQPIQTHCIPALAPVVEGVFLSRNLSEDKELETQREVFLSMLLRLAEFPDVMEMIGSILNESKAVGEKERWKRWSRQVIDVILPLAGQDRLRIETFEGQNSFVNLMSALSPNVLRPIDPLLRVLFVEPNDYNCCASLGRWLSRVTVLLETVLFIKEDALLNRLEEISPGSVNLSLLVPAEGNSTFPDPFDVGSFFQVWEPSETMARFVLKIVSAIAGKISESFASSFQLRQKLSTFFVCVYHVLKSGTFHRISHALRNLLARERDFLAATFSLFKKLVHLSPLLLCQFSYFLALLNFCDRTYWSDVLREPRTLPSKLAQFCGIVSLSDYLVRCDNLSDTDTLHYLLRNNVQEILSLSHEIPVRELLATIRRRKSDWTVMMEAISSKDFQNFEPGFVEKLLRLLESTDNSPVGNHLLLLLLLVKKYLSSPRLALSLLAGSIACRQVEFLLTLPRDKVLEEIDRDSFEKDLMKFFDDKSHLKRHFNLWSLLNRLKAQVFESGKADSNQSRMIRMEEEVKNLRPDEDWYFDQVKQRCCQTNSPGPEMASLLSKLNYEKISEILSSPDFNLKILKDCLMHSEKLREKYGLQEGNDGDQSFRMDNPLRKASEFRVLEIVKGIREDLIECQKEFGPKIDSAEVLEKITSKKDLNERIWTILPSLTVLLESVYEENSDVGKEYVEGIAELGVLCIEIIGWKSRSTQQDSNPGEIHQSHLEIGFNCLSAILKSPKINSFLSLPSNRDKIKSFVKNIYSYLSRTIPSCRFKRIRTGENLSEDDSESVQLRFLLEFVRVKSNRELISSHPVDCIGEVIVKVCRLPELSSHLLKVPESCDLQDLESLEGFISRFSVIGWRSKQKFEEIWVALLGVLGFDGETVEETGFVVQASAVAVEGITTLLKNTLLDSGGKKLIHHGRDVLSMKHFAEKLPIVNGVYKRSDRFGDRSYHFLDNLEISRRDDKYVHGLLSVEYLWTAIKQITSQIDLYENHSRALNSMGLDLPSCIHLLTELYSQWVHQTCPDIKIVTSSLKSSIVISDLFTDLSQFQWLLNFCLRIEEIVLTEDFVILPMIILGSSKAGAIVLPNCEICEKIKKLMLRSSSSPCRIATVQGLLYLLQSYVVCYSVNHKNLPPPGSAFRGDEANFVGNIVDTFLPVALEVVQQFICKSETTAISAEFERCHWSLIFYLLQNYESSLGDLKAELLNFIIDSMRSRNCSDSLMGLLIRGIERLLLTTIVDDNFKDQVAKISLEIISHNSITTSGHGLQLVMILSFLDKRVKDVRQLVAGQDDPEKIMKDMEKINALFEKLKKSYPKEAEVVGEVLSYILSDFQASDVLTRVIQEFLSTQQPHQKILAGLLFKVFERAELSLLEDWVVFSLPNFIQGLPIPMSIWILNCFFVSASSEPWLRSMFPLVQSRIRMAEEEDKKLLCLSGAHFYRQLKEQSQKKSFVEAFEKAAKTDKVFEDLLSSLF